MPIENQGSRVAIFNKKILQIKKNMVPPKNHPNMYISVANKRATFAILRYKRITNNLM